MASNSAQNQSSSNRNPGSPGTNSAVLPPYYHDENAPNSSKKNRNPPSSTGSGNAGSLINSTHNTNVLGDYIEQDERVRFNNQWFHIRGRITCNQKKLVAIESEKPMIGYTGRCPECGADHFKLNPQQGYYADARTLDEALSREKLEEKRKRGRKSLEDLHKIRENLHPLDQPLLGTEVGIEGDSNSCYMDSTLFCMFAYSNVFDSLLHVNVESGSATELVQTLLRDNIAHVLRYKPGLVDPDTIYYLREQLSLATKDRTFLEVEKDPSELLRAFEQLFHYAPLKTIAPDRAPTADQPNITSNIIWEMFDANTNKLQWINIGSIFRNSLKEIPAKLATIPPFLVVIAPRHGRSQRSYPYIIPDQKIDLDTDIVQVACAQCKITTSTAKNPNDFYTWRQSGLEILDPSLPIIDATIQCFCSNCIKERLKMMSIEEREKQEVKKFSLGKQALHLFAVLCIETSHYVAFVKCQNQRDGHQWLFFDSMSDRVCDEKNIPCVSVVPDFDDWILKAADSEKYFSKLDERRNRGVPTSQAFKGDDMRRLRLFRDGAFFFYENPIANYQ